MPRELITHKIPGLNDGLTITVLDEPGEGGACHDYAIGWRNQAGDTFHCDIFFQKGPIHEAEVNGVSIEALLALCIDRLEGFQAGAYACEQNAEALEYVKTALYWLHARTQDRLARGVEGTGEA